MRHRGQSLFVGVSGPDGAGKTTLIDQLAQALRGLGFHPITAYGYGCVVCRRMPARQPRQPPPGSGWRSRRAAIGTTVRRVHAVVDASELAIRLASARFKARAAGRRWPTVVLTDRGPLDGLVKFDVAPTSAGAALFCRIAARYDVTLLLDASPEVLEARDGTDSLDQVADRCGRYRRWCRRVPAVVLVDSGRQPPAVLAVALRSILDGHLRPAKSAMHPDRETARKHVVLSNFDDVGNPHYRGGGAVVIEKLARSLAEDFRVTVVTAARRPGTEARGKVCYRYLPVGWAGPRAGQLLFHAGLPIIARRLQHDLWMESFTPPFSTSFLPLVSPAPVVGIGQQLSGAAMRQRYHVPFDIVERFGLRFYRNVVALNDTDCEILRRRNPAAAVHVIPNGVDRRRVSETHLGQGEHILFLGRIDLYCKGLDLLLRAYAKAAPPMPLVLAGSGTASQERKLARMLAQNGRGVTWVGPVDGACKLDLLVRSAFLVLPSRNESFGLAALEAMSWGKPVLHFDLPGLRWMRGNGDVPVSPFDTDDLATKLCELAADVQLRRRLGRKAYLAAQRYSWEETTARYRSLVRHLLDGSAPEATGIQVCGRLR